MLSQFKSMNNAPLSSFLFRLFISYLSPFHTIFLSIYRNPDGRALLPGWSCFANALLNQCKATHRSRRTTGGDVMPGQDTG